MYEIIVLGATFAAAGIAHRYKKSCLILEESLQAGNEFYGALQFGHGYDRTPRNEEAKNFQESFLGSDLYDRITQIYPYLQQADVLFNVRPVSIKKSENGFVCEVYGADGFCTFEAKQVIDTRADDEISISKTYNVLIESAETPEFEGCIFEKGGMDNHYVLRLPIPLGKGYAEARAEIQNAVCRFSESQKLILSAAAFDYKIKEGFPVTRDGIIRLPSKAYINPVLAFEAGLEVAL